MAQYTSSYTGAQIDSAIDTVGGLGTASTKNFVSGIYGTTDAGSQNLPTVSAVVDFQKRTPIMNYPPNTVTDLNIVKECRFDDFTSLTGVSNAPSGIARGGCLTLGYYNETWTGLPVLQIFTSGDGKIFMRCYWNGTWFSWKEV